MPRLILGVLVLAAKRLFLLSMGIALTYIITWILFPAFNKNYSVVTAILLTYLVSAYLLIPAGIRIIRLWYRPKYIPHFTKTPDGFNCDPINIGVVGTEHQLKTAMRKMGWHKADSKNIRNTIKLLLSVLTKQTYLHAPFSSLFLFGRKQDIGFQKQSNGSYFNRHHVRFWACSQAVRPQFVEHVLFWQHKLSPETNTRLLWVGAAIKDSGLGFIRYHGQLTHSVDADTNAERDFIVGELQAAGLVKKLIIVQANKKARVPNRVFGDYMISDGELHVCILK